MHIDTPCIPYTRRWQTRSALTYAVQHHKQLLKVFHLCCCQRTRYVIAIYRKQTVYNIMIARNVMMKNSIAYQAAALQLHRWIYILSIATRLTFHSREFHIFCRRHHTNNDINVGSNYFCLIFQKEDKRRTRSTRDLQPLWRSNEDM